VIIAYVVKTPGDLRELGKWIFFGGVATVSLGAVNMVLGLTPGATVLGGAKLMRFSGTQLNPNYAAALMLSVLPLGVFYLKHAPKLFLKVIGIAGIVVLIAGVFATLSRAAIFAFAVVIFGVLLREVRSRKTGVAIILLFVIGILFSPRYYWVRVTAITDISNSIVNDWSFYMRYVALLGAWEAFLDHPFFGVGLRNFSTSLGSGSIIPIGPHNMYVGLLAELGITGLAMYLVIQFSAFRHMVSGFRAQWPENYSWLNDLSYYLALGVIAALISGVFMDCEYSYVVWIPVGAGIALGCLRQEFGNRPAGERS
jgi:O-antigen ligase